MGGRTRAPWARRVVRAGLAATVFGGAAMVAYLWVDQSWRYSVTMAVSLIVVFGVVPEIVGARSRRRAGQGDR
ncbi:hypothetical protein [Streptomyces sp. NPDC057257]|uniref:hypothetical protein n=1 Tax=Streptomyces sp. NPDC057257 TaxID=3346071 RepID=UPI00364050DE